jgi:hypothetical protein
MHGQEDSRMHNRFIYFAVVAVFGTFSAACATVPDDNSNADTAGSGDTAAPADTNATDGGDDTPAIKDVSNQADVEDIPISPREEVDVPEPSPCPPTGPFGTEMGDIMTDLSLYDCNMNKVSLHDLCGKPAALVNLFAAW